MRISKTLAFAAFAALSASAVATPQPVRISGTTTARGELLKDVVNNIIQFAPAYDCTIASSIQADRIDSVRIPPRASFRVSGLDVTYEEWVADFCGQSVAFMVKLQPDPAGGTSILIDYPYPADAPHAR